MFVSLDLPSKWYLLFAKGRATSLLRRPAKMKDQKSRNCVKGITFAVSLLVVSACTSQTVKMIQPQTGATAECNGSSFGIGPLFSENFVDSCARVYENRGYVPVQRLTPEERANLERRGLLPKD
jgi:hypothetical protein